MLAPRSLFQSFHQCVISALEMHSKVLDSTRSNDGVKTHMAQVATGSMAV